VLFITLKKEQNNFSKCSAFASSPFLYLIFQPAIFADWGRKNFLPKGAEYPIATPLLQRWALNLGLQINSAKWKIEYRNNYSCTLHKRI